MLKQVGETVHELQRTFMYFLCVTKRKVTERESLEFHELFHHYASACDLTLMQRLKKMKSYEWKEMKPYGWREMKPYGWREMKPTKNIGDFFPFCIHCHCR
jgi:hypothetical protein